MMTSSAADIPVLSAEDLTKVYGKRSLFGLKESFTAVENVSFELRAGKTLGIVGESGCGKSTLSKILAGITPPTAGLVFVDGQHVGKGSRQEQRARLSSIQMVFQSPAGSLDPRMRVDQIVAEPLDIHRPDLSKKAKRGIVIEIMKRVGMSDSYLNRYAHELSGGQQQRIGIARALITDPKVVICDEAVSALDVSVQAQIINLLLDIQEITGVAFIFISHDLSVVAAISDDIAVMYMGRVVEEGNARTVLSNPAHPYTSLLLESAFVPDPQIERKRIHSSIADTSSTLARPAVGCPFRPRCPVSVSQCATVMPELALTDRGTSRVACHNYH